MSAERFYTAGLLRVDPRHADCDRYDGLVCGCGGCSCHSDFPATAHVLVVPAAGAGIEHPLPGRVVRAEPDVAFVALVDTEDKPCGEPTLYCWNRNRARFVAAGGVEAVLRPLVAVLGLNAAPAEVVPAEASVRVTAAHALGSGWVVSVILTLADRTKAREECVPVLMGAGGALLLPKADRLADVVRRAEAMALRWRV